MKVKLAEFCRYIVAGGLATVVDWGIFFLLAIRLSIYYQYAVACSFFLGSVTNYILNKVFTFRCPSKQIAGQFAAHAGISAASLGLNMGLMFVLVDQARLHKMASRIIASGIMLVLNYFLHKYITFNRKVFR